MALEEYKRKRDFNKTPEPPPPGTVNSREGFSYLIQKHDATRLHYDLRLELDGVLLSWAVTKGPSLDPANKRLAVHTEDHPLSYGTFEGTIPKGEYGGGTVMLWDRGTWEPKGDPRAGLKKGHLKFFLHGERLKGGWDLVRMHGDGKKENWLLIKEKDDAALDSGEADTFLAKEASSITTRRSMDEIAVDAPPAVKATSKDPHSLAFGSDGSIYFTSPNSNVVLRLDPKSGGTKLFPVPTSKALPETIALGSDGATWFCEFGANQLGRLDPVTGAITELVIPDEKERPRRMVMSGNAIYFTDFGSGHLGRYDIVTKKFQSWPSPSGAGSQPYGIGADSAGKIWFYETASNQLVRFDPVTEKLDVFAMPSAKSNVVAMARDAQGHLWMPLTAMNKVADIE